MEEKVLSVSQFNAVVKAVLENEPMLMGITMTGEISNFKAYPSGHLYFTMKDEESAIACVMFRGNAGTLRFRPADGMKVKVKGNATVYGKDGKYQFNVRTMEAEGAGGLYAAYEKLKAKLQSEGLFEISRKKPLPRFPKKIGVITSIAGAAIRDILNVTERRYPAAEIYIYPSAVQGEEAPGELCRAVEYFSQKRNVDLLIIGRGGGSIEDLWAFNNERLARMLAACPIPTISAVGHETDFTICDFVCDRRAPTPSAAAELAVPDRNDLIERLMKVEDRMKTAVNGAINRRREEVRRLSASRALTDPLAPLRIQRGNLRSTAERFDLAARNCMENKARIIPEYERRMKAAHAFGFERKKSLFTRLCGQMNGLNPMAVLSRGYGAVFDGEGKVVRSAKSIEVGSELTLKLCDGSAKARVFEVRMNEGEKENGKRI